MNKGLTIRMGQTHVNRWTDDLLRRIEKGQIDPSFVVTHRVDLEDGPAMYKTFRDKEDGCVKVVLQAMKREKPMSRNRTMDMHSTEYAHSMARGLGWFSIGLGLAEVLAPRVLTRGLGMENEQLVRAYGLREIATGIGILVGPACPMDMGTCRG